MGRILYGKIFLMSLFFGGMQVQAQSDEIVMKKAEQIVTRNEKLLENSNQLLVVYNDVAESYAAVFVAFERKGSNWIVKEGPVDVGIGKNGFALPLEKREGDGKSPTGVFRLGKLFSYEKQQNTLLENQQTTADDKWIDDPNSDQYNRYVQGATDAKSYENLVLKNDAYKYCMVIEYNTNPIIKGAGSAIFFHLAVKKPVFTAGCVAIDETNMKLMVNWLDPQQNPMILMGNYGVLKNGL
ncbi:L,D-transpeptidase family protein [Flavobacterium muglaense]|uniref:L,D-transpeptidase family protein n=1 Tax=Flavobacterium muglaense TaxID=2764716 RepID=A0A923N194_9FLAO|nr:L,D-transpeptidase family protein [Flavobacterium muglaense]MBC5837739.1 L,D-transpeptidase family protein [Flavobacterium muglaense]MBC5844265.1 L,D-transpeptidase family protein [Flavobacterium muglaense]